MSTIQQNPTWSGSTLAGSFPADVSTALTTPGRYAGGRRLAALEVPVGKRSARNQDVTNPSDIRVVTRGIPV